MTFSQRLTRFIIGLLIGVVLSVLFFSDRGCTSWLPKERIIGRINSKTIIYTPEAQCLLDCYSIEQARTDSILTQGNVNLKKSDTRAEEKVYRIEEYETGEDQYYVNIAESDSLVRIIEIGEIEKSRDCDCD